MSSRPEFVQYLLDQLEGLGELRARKMFGDYPVSYTHLDVYKRQGLARVSAWVRLKYAAMNLKKIAIGKWNASNFASYIMIFAPFNDKTPVLVF